jgi:hypothetical protein
MNAGAKRPTYRQAIEWMASNDDNEWAAPDGEDVIPSVTASLISDIFGVPMERVICDLQDWLKKDQNRS